MCIDFAAMYKKTDCLKVVNLLEMYANVNVLMDIYIYICNYSDIEIAAPCYNKRVYLHIGTAKEYTGNRLAARI